MLANILHTVLEVLLLLYVQRHFIGTYLVSFVFLRGFHQVIVVACVSPPDTSSVEVLDCHLVPFLDLPLLQN